MLLPPYELGGARERSSYPDLERSSYPDLERSSYPLSRSLSRVSYLRPPATDVARDGGPDGGGGAPFVLAAHAATPSGTGGAGSSYAPI
ncbi:hypothetical protein FS749_007881 [Ceratobasidium sp. UAMH 11750]|nr:hypothetical protein FS749_007881 [Ceratobasidium sp. UAMH 11750]